MKAVVIRTPGGPEVLEVRDVPIPEPGRYQIQVRVRASGLNRADLLQREGKYPAPPGVPQEIPGLEFAGEVSALGQDASRWTLGQRVFGILGGGAHAEFIVTHEDAVAAIPDGIPWNIAAAVPEVYITAHDAMTQARIQPGESVLIHSVGSGVGIAAVQLARAMGAVPFGTSRTADKLERAREQGMEAGTVIASAAGPEDFAALKSLAAAHTKSGFNVVLDLVGGPYVAGSVPAMSLSGRIMLIGTVAGRTAELPLGAVLSKRLTIKGTVLRARPLEEKIAVTSAFAEDVVPLLAAGKLRPVLDQELPMDAAADAHRRLASNQTFGKVVLLIPR